MHKAIIGFALMLSSIPGFAQELATVTGGLMTKTDNDVLVGVELIDMVNDRRYELMLDEAARAVVDLNAEVVTVTGVLEIIEDGERLTVTQYAVASDQERDEQLAALDTAMRAFSVEDVEITMGDGLEAEAPDYAEAGSETSFEGLVSVLRIDNELKEARISNLERDMRRYGIVLDQTGRALADNAVGLVKVRGTLGVHEGKRTITILEYNMP